MRPAHLLLASFTVQLWLILSLKAEEFRPNLGPDLERITVECGNLTLLLRQKSQWTSGRIDFRGVAMTTEKSAYGTVFNFPEVGFIGTAHLENEPEDLQSLAFFVDGEPTDPQSILRGDSFRFERDSRVRGFRLKNTIDLKNDRLYETATVSNLEAIPLKLVYHFMHAWTPSVSALIAGNDDSAELIRQELGDGAEVTRKFYVQERVDWIAVFEPDSGQFAVSRLLAAPQAGDHISKVWNVPGTYRKYYLKCFLNNTVPADFSGTWKMVTGFGEADAASWETAARGLAVQLKEENGT